MSLRKLAALPATLLLLSLLFSSAVPAGAQSTTVQSQIINSVLEKGWWDESSLISPTEISPVIEEWGNEFAFAITDRALAVEGDPDRNAAALLAQSTLDLMVQAGGPETLLLVTEDNVGGASTKLPFLNLMTALEDFDRTDPEGSFARAAATAAALGTEIEAVAPTAQTSSFLTGGQIFVMLGILAAILALASIRSSRKKRLRRVHTTGARDDTNLQLQEMSELILDLDPRVTIENDPELKERYVDASSTYREVLEAAQVADEGHEIADLRIAIAKARWKLDVIDAELDDRDPPPEPFTRDTSGSAWDSTRGTGAS